MTIKLVVALTDDDWFFFLREQIGLEEVNFWSPSATNFRALTPGELFLFKLHSPRNFVVGGGIFSHATTLPCSLAWETFREANGAVSERAMRVRIARYRRVPFDERDDFTIGCRILTQPFFLAEQNWIGVPASFAPNVVRFKTYVASDGDGLSLWNAVQDRLTRDAPFVADAGPRYGTPHLVAPRLGQGAFRAIVTDLYNRRCAVTEERTLPALEAAHIRPFADGGPHDARNGLLLRRDLHSLFDKGYITVTPVHRLEVSRRIREEFENGRMYYALHGTEMRVPKIIAHRPDPTALEWHNEHRFKG